MINEQTQSNPRSMGEVTRDEVLNSQTAPELALPTSAVEGSEKKLLQFPTVTYFINEWGEIPFPIKDAGKLGGFTGPGMPPDWSYEAFLSIFDTHIGTIAAAKQSLQSEETPHANARLSGINEDFLNLVVSGNCPPLVLARVQTYGPRKVLYGPGQILDGNARAVAAALIAQMPPDERHQYGIQEDISDIKIRAYVGDIGPVRAMISDFFFLAICMANGEMRRPWPPLRNRSPLTMLKDGRRYTSFVDLDRYLLKRDSH